MRVGVLAFWILNMADLVVYRLELSPRIGFR